MKDLPIMDVFNSKAYLGEPVKNLLLAHIVLHASFIALLPQSSDVVLESATITIIHDNVEDALPILVDLSKSNNIGMAQSLQDLGLLDSELPLIFIHLINLDLLDDSIRLIRLASDQISRTISTLSKL